MTNYKSNSFIICKTISIVTITSAMTFFGVSTLSGCQKSNDADNESSIQTPDITSKTDTQDQAAEVTSPKAVADISDGNDIGNTANDSTESIDTPKGLDHKSVSKVTSTNPNATVATGVDLTSNNGDKPLSAEEQKIAAEKQITDVEYQSQEGDIIRVTFQTSALEALEADVILPSGQHVVLIAPRGQGNNPTYRSKDGSIELVTHGGGGSIDLLYEGKQTSFDAISAEAEVVSAS